MINEYIKLADFFKETLGKYYDCFLLEYNNGELKPCESNFINDDIEEYYQVVLNAINDDKNEINKIVTVNDSRLNKLSVKLIKENNKTVGALCVVLKCNALFKIEGIINDFLNIEDYSEDKKYPLSLEGIDEYISSYGFEDAKPNKNEKTEIICDLYNMGMFDIKGAVQKVADRLGMSSKSVYRYISNVRETRE